MGLKRIWITSAVCGALLAGIQIYHLEAIPPEANSSPTFAELIQPLVRWPCEVTLKKNLHFLVKKHGMPVGYVVANAGIQLTAYDLTKDGMVEVQFVDQIVHVEMENTNLLDRVSTLRE